MQCSGLGALILLSVLWEYRDLVLLLGVEDTRPLTIQYAVPISFADAYLSTIAINEHKRKFPRRDSNPGLVRTTFPDQLDYAEAFSDTSGKGPFVYI